MQLHTRVHDLAAEYRLYFSPYWAPQPDVFVQCTNHTTVLIKDYKEAVAIIQMRDDDGLDQQASGWWEENTQGVH